jgi:DnaA-homolog protein
MKQLTLDLAGTPPATLDNFVVGRNAELLHQLKQLPARASGERFIYVWGMPGSGRSHLLRGTITAMRAAGAEAAYVACSGAAPFARVTAPLNFLAIDDVEHLDEQGQGKLFNIYNTLRENRGALLASGNAPPARLELREDVVTRLGWGLVYQVHPLSDEEKTQALRRHAAARGFALSDEVCGYLLQRVRRDMPSLLAMLDALDRYSLETKREVTVPLVRELLHAVPRPEGAAKND